MDAEPNHPPSRAMHRLTEGLWALALAGLIYLAGLTVWLGLTGLVFPYQLDYGEGFMLHFVREWAAGRPIYKTAEGYPYCLANYPPLTIALALGLTPILGLTYTAGRVWTLLALVATAILIVAWVRRDTGRWLPAAVAALLFVGSPYIYHWAPLFRVDLVGLALTLGGLYTVYVAYPPAVSRSAGRERPGLIWLAAVLFVAGLYAKHSFIFAPAAALAYLFLQAGSGSEATRAGRRQALNLAVGMAVLGGGLFLLINLLTKGSFWYALVLSNVNPFLWPEFWKQQADFFGTFAVLGLLAAWYIADKYLLDRARPVRDKVSPLDLYLPAALLSLWFAGKAGSWENYFFEALAAFALCAGLGLARLNRHPRPLARALAPLLVLVQVGLMWHTPGVAQRYLVLTRQSNEAISPFVAATPDPIVSEDMGALVANDKVLDYCSFQYSQLARAGRWDQAWELGQLRDRRFSAVILEQGTRLDVDHYQRFTREFLSEMDRNYRLARTAGKFEIYEPDPLQHGQRAEFGDELALVGWSVHAPPKLQPGDTITLTTVWQAQQALDEDLTAFAHLVDEGGQGWAGDDHPPYDGLYPTGKWGADEMVRDTFTLTVPAGAPPGLYTLEVGWYDPATQERLPVDGGTSYRVALLPVSWPTTSGGPLEPVGVHFGEAITLEGYRQEVGPDGLKLILRWSAEAPTDTDYTVFVHLVDPSRPEEVLAQGDAPPLSGRWPTSQWPPGAVLDDPHTVALPPDLPPGTYALLVGLYDPATAARLTLPDGRDALRLGNVSLP